MTASTTFRECRPFSFLYSTSSSFMNAQTNLTLMNALIWETCNTPMSNDQCQSNMASFTSSLHTACSQELNNQNLLVVNSLIALQAFQVMYESACLINPITNAYCFLSAVQNSNPSDLYFYSLPLGIPLPKTSTPSCSACSKTLMGIYATTLQVPSQAKLLTALKSAYIVSAEIAAQFCGAGFAKTLASAAMSLSCGWRIIFIGFIFTWTLTHYSWYLPTFLTFLMTFSLSGFLFYFNFYFGVPGCHCGLASALFALIGLSFLTTLKRYLEVFVVILFQIQREGWTIKVCTSWTTQPTTRNETSFSPVSQWRWSIRDRSPTSHC